MKNTFNFIIQEIGVLRLLLLSFAILLSLFMPAPQTPVELTTWRIIPTLLIPTLIPLVILVILLDVMMTRILMSGQTPIVQQRFWRIIGYHGIAVILLLSVWLPYFVALKP